MEVFCSGHQGLHGPSEISSLVRVNFRHPTSEFWLKPNRHIAPGTCMAFLLVLYILIPFTWDIYLFKLTGMPDFSWYGLSSVLYNPYFFLWVHFPPNWIKWNVHMRIFVLQATPDQIRLAQMFSDGSSNNKPDEKLAEKIKQVEQPIHSSTVWFVMLQQPHLSYPDQAQWFLARAGGFRHQSSKVSQHIGCLKWNDTLGIERRPHPFVVFCSAACFAERAACSGHWAGQMYCGGRHPKWMHITSQS